jgi:hypothetical protein
MSNNKKTDMEVPDDDDKYDEDYEDEGRLHDALLRKIGMLCQRCVKYKRIIKRLKMELRLSKSHARQTKFIQGLITIGMARRFFLLTRF